MKTEKCNVKEISRQELVVKINEHVNRILRQNLYELKLDEHTANHLMQRKQELRDNLRRAGCGDLEAKKFLVQFIKESLMKLYGFTENTIEQTFLFLEKKSRKAEFCFDEILYYLQKKYEDNALEFFMEENGLNPTVSGRYEIDETTICTLYKQYDIRLDFQDKLELLSRKVYAFYKGLGVIDEIRDMKIDGVSGGVSGNRENYANAWIFYKGQSVHLSFLDFESEAEMERICRNMCRYRQPGELSKKKGYLVHEMADHARVVVARPDFAECWLFFIRKLDNLPKSSLMDLLKDENRELPVTVLSWLMKGCQNVAITGMQGCGKTTLLMALVEQIPREYTLRVLELAFELHLRERYQKRNIVTFRETANVDGFDALEVQKKTDGAVSIIGEVASAKVAAWMIESGQTGSLFSLFTHHAKTTERLLYSLRNSLLKEANFRSEQIALSQVVEVVRFDVHLHMDRDGHRYIERITEIIPMESGKGFRTVDLMYFDGEQYVQGAHISMETRKDMARQMTKKEREAFAHVDI